jgi:hypothetical protein
MVATSKTDTAEPRRTKLRTDKEDPTVALPMIDSLNREPNRRQPQTDSDEPMRAKDLTDNEEPMFWLSSTDIVEPRREKARSDSDAPMCAKLSTDIEDPI